VLPLISRIKCFQTQLRCIVTTLYDDSDELLASLRAGADGYVAIDDAVFVPQLQEVISGSPRLTTKLARRLIAEFGLRLVRSLASANAK